MAVKTFTTGEVLTAADTNTYLANSGLVFVKQVTVGSGVSTVNVTSCFSSTYTNYRVMWQGIAASANSYMGVKLLVGTTVNAANGQGNTFYVATAAAGGLTNANYANALVLEAGNVTTSSDNAGWIEVQQPFATKYTYTQACSADNNYLRWANFVMTNATSYDGIQLLPGSGTLTGGTITVYGYRLG